MDQGEQLPLHILAFSHIHPGPAAIALAMRSAAIQKPVSLPLSSCLFLF
jgi:hypothetical protein